MGCKFICTAIELGKPLKPIAKLACGLALLLAGGLLPEPSWAGPDICVASNGGTVQTCTGNQSNGIAFAAPVTTLNVQSLTQSIAPAPGVTGIQFGSNGAALTLNTDATVSIITSATAVTSPYLAAPGIDVRTIGANGAAGAAGSSSTPGGAGGPGSAGGTVTITNNGTVVSSFAQRPFNTRAVEGGPTTQQDLSTAQTTLKNTQDEIGIRDFLSTAADDATKAACGNVLPCPANKLQDPAVRAALRAQPDSAYALLFGSIAPPYPEIDTSSANLVAKERTASVTAEYLNAHPLPQEVADRNGVIRAQSQGGAGNNGGAGNGNLGDPSSTWAGGAGGAGAAAGAVTVNNTGVVTSSGTYLHGILATSTGGNGGNGGDGGTGTGGAGGVGGVGGDAGTVTVTNSGKVTTVGGGAAGIFAQSVGGTGGTGGATGLSQLNGVAGGNAGQVLVTHSGSITTQGDSAIGIFAQSLGGTGGAGGSSVADTTGTGGNGGASDAVKVVLTGTGSIATSGISAYGVFASSVGGTGGTGQGGTQAGGTGGTAANVEVQVQKGALITTSGDSAYAVYAQSMGGSGGGGGMVAGLWGAGGGGGNGGLGGNVTVTNAGTLITSGKFAYGIFAQALGGSGGIGGSAAGLVAISGAGGGGVPAGNVLVNNSGAISTMGTSAHAIFAQSVAGGGGDAGSAGGLVALGGNGSSQAAGFCTSANRAQCNDAGTVTVNNSGVLSVGGSSAYGIFAESVGGGGGNGGSSAGLFAFGGTGGAGGNGGAVTVTNQGMIAAQGAGTMAIFAQSVGGGGGNGGNASALGFGTSIALGGSGGNGGDGGAVLVTNTANLSVSDAQSTGIFAQSVGGGGGTAGTATANAPKFGFFTLSIGGSGGQGGNGGTVTVTNNGAIAASGASATGIVAQSVGGGGGDGGAATSSGSAPVVQLSIAIGGSGAIGGAGGDVMVTNNGSVRTTDISARGLFAQSVGGGGGSGGDASASSTVTAAAKVNVSAGLAIGGTGAAGNDAGAVTVTNNGLIVTQGDEAHGIQAQSVGGGGGNGGNATASATLESSSGSSGFTIGASIAVGGTAGGGGNGGIVTVANNGTISTSGNDAYGIFAQSVGGGGGSGGNATATAQAGSTGCSSCLPVSVSVGGTGGSGGTGDQVTVSNTGAIVTAGVGSYALFAQSVGGGGGAGGSADSSSGSRLTAKVSVGGSGDFGGAGGTVQISNSGAITTTGDSAIAVLAQSIGGGGGNGGSASATSSVGDNSNGTSFTVSVGVGGSGAGGGAGGIVSITNSGTIATFGNESFGVLAQSVGGGGGIGGGASVQGNDANYTLAVSVGGKGGTASAGGVVTLTNSGKIATTGSLSYGLYAQSVGGGGGIGGNASSIAGGSNTEGGQVALAIGGNGGAGGAGGLVTLTNSGRIDTFGYGAHGIFAQSIGGGGGSGGAGDAETEGKVGVGATIGGSAGGSGNGGVLNVSNSNTIVTRGNDAYGMLVQSIGGGGGEGIGDGGSGSSQLAGTRSIGINVGGGGSSAGDGGAVVVNQGGSIITMGTQAYGILAQSIGGGGGIGGAGESNRSTEITVGGANGANGNGGSVLVNLTGNITTLGDGAHGLFAQSIGGGGGIAGNTSIDGTNSQTFGQGATQSAGGGANGNGGAVTIVSSGTIVTLGREAYGIVAQSIGGGGGLAASSNGTTSTLAMGSSSGGTGSGGAVSVTSSGNVFAMGADSHAIFAQSVGPSGNGNISVTLNGGTVMGGTANGAGIYLDGGSTNIVTVGSGAAVSALSNNAVVSTGGDAISNTVNNSGIVTGNIRLGAGAGTTNAFNNLAGGTFNTGATVDLSGNGFQLANGGLVEVGGHRLVATTALTGSFTQTAGGILAMDVRFGAGTSDLLAVSGTTNLAGTLRPTNLYLMPNQTAVTILTSAGGITNNGLSVVNTPTITYGLDFTNPNALVLTVNGVHFTGPSNLTGNQRALAGYFQNLWNSGGAPALADAMGYLVNLSAGDYASALDHLNPTAHLVNANTAATTGQSFANALLSCYGFDGTFAAIREHECAWAKVSGSTTTQTANSGNPGYNEQGVRVQAGAQFQIKPDWFLGFGVGYERANGTVGAAATYNASRYDIGAILKYVNGPWLLAGALEAGYAGADTTRSIGFPAPATTAYSNSGTWHLDGKLRAAYLLEMGNVYAKPMVDGDVMYLHMPGFSEYGAGALNLNVNGMSDVLFSATPALELGVTAIDGGDHVLRPRLSVGATFFSKNSLSVGANFAGSPAGSAPFTTTTTFPQVVAKVSGGIDLFSKRQTGGLDIRLQYDGQFADGFQSHSGGIKASMRF